MLLTTSPTKTYLKDIDIDKVKSHLEYHDQKVDFELAKHKKAHWFIGRYGREAWQEKLELLKSQRIKSLLFQDENGYWIYSGLANAISGKIHDSVSNLVEYPDCKCIPWYRKPNKTPRPYQDLIVSKLIEAKHGGVEAGTGLGKSHCALLLAKHFGLKTVIMTPSISIANQMYDEFLYHFGSKYIGKFGDGKKEYKKLFTVAISNSLALLKDGDIAFDTLSQSKVFIADESHLCPAQTLARVCFGVMANAPYRFFFSGTQIRNDGLDLLLDAITGDIVFKMTVKEGVDQGYLAKPIFRIINLKSDMNCFKDDPNEQTRAHLYYNPKVNEIAGSVVNQMIEELGRPVVILIEEMEQFTSILPYLRHEVKFAHGGCTKENMNKVPELYRKKPNIKELVEDFNNGKYKILVGTSCIGTGTDIRSVGAIVYLQGGRSEIQIKQAIGRGTRLVPGKTDCFFIDFDVYSNSTTHRHSIARRNYYQEVYQQKIEEITL